MIRHEISLSANLWNDFAEQQEVELGTTSMAEESEKRCGFLQVAVWPRPGIDLFNHDAHAHLGEPVDDFQWFMHVYAFPWKIWGFCLYRRKEMDPWTLQTSSPLREVPQQFSLAITWIGLLVILANRKSDLPTTKLFAFAREATKEKTANVGCWLENPPLNQTRGDD